MRLIIHDLRNDEFQSIFPDLTAENTVISDDGSIHHCIGCFGCWIKTPAACVIRDRYGDMGEHISKCKEIIIISRCCYGGFSPFVKNVMDRSISYVHPYFKIINGEMHHRNRYKNNISLQVWFYGDGTAENEKLTAQKLIKANSVNLGINDSKVTFVNSYADIKELIG